MFFGHLPNYSGGGYFFIETNLGPNYYRKQLKLKNSFQNSSNSCKF